MATATPEIQTATTTTGGATVANVFDVAKYILELGSPMSTMKLQKLVYYSQAWSLVWDDRALFDEPIRAWAGGPVVAELWQEHRGAFRMQSADSLRAGNSGNLDDVAKATIQAIVTTYGQYDGQALSELTHAEAPWANARRGLGLGDRGNTVIELDDMADYYTALDADGEELSTAG